MKPKKKKVGRPKILIDWNEFDKLCHIQCTLKEISDWFGCAEDTIRRRCFEERKLNFETLLKKKSTGGKISLRRSQFKLATEGNPALNIWLGKQYLGQRDKYEDGHQDIKPQPVKIEFVAVDGRVIKDAS